MSAHSERYTLLPASAKDSERKKCKDFFFLCNVSETCQAILFKEIRVVVLKVTSVEQV